MSEQNRKQLPIGFWLKRADELLKVRIDEAQRSNRLARLDWQLLNVIREGRAAGRDELLAVLQPFADSAAVNAALEGLIERRVIRGSTEEGFDLTPAGTALYERALLAQQTVRQRAVSGITQSEYATTVSVLRRLVENLERDDGP